MRKILVIRGGALGDFVLTLPVLAALRAKFPSHSIEILGYPRIASLAVASALADGVSALESPALAGFFVRNGDRPQEAVEYFRNFELIVSYAYDPQHIFQHNIADCTAAQFVAGPHRPDESLNSHATKLLLRPLEVLGICDADPRPRLPIQAESIEKDRLALHPGSGSERKNWPENAWSEFLQLLSAKSKFKLLLVGGEAEGLRCQRLSDVVSPERADIAQDIPLVPLARRMKSCGGFIGHDSGISHLAAALDLPGLVLWGETAEKIWRPASDLVELIRHPRGLAHLPVEMVWDHLKKSRMAASAA
jgi:heptosyltransferase-2